MSSPLAGKHAVVTGGGRGIGAAVARALAEQGATLTLMGRDHGRLDAQAQALASAPEIHTLRVDVANADSVQDAFARAQANAGPVQILINNAGAAESAPFARTDLALWMRMLDVNLTGTYLCCRQVVPGMLERGFGRVVNIASTAGLTGYAYVTAYCAAKHGVVGLTRALALETARSNVTVNAVCPGYTDTDMLSEAVANIVRKTGKTEAEARAALTAHNPQQRVMRPEEVANTVLWLCLPGAEAITGQAIAVAGGEVL
ncbi:MAG TPA: SDR family NAD(P)-dependent oxidoreductase [Burkholderiales bacterium]|nr:SDR family NAD(P)-dependent oxidoreductase [Burkholderiales bacterium]